MEFLTGRNRHRNGIGGILNVKRQNRALEFPAKEPEHAS